MLQKWDVIHFKNSNIFYIISMKFLIRFSDKLNILQTETKL